MFYVYHIESSKGQYIGMTSNAVKREQDHLSSLKRGDHTNVALQKAYDETGQYAFYVITTRNDKRSAETLEREIMEETPDIFNVTIGTGRYGDNVTPPTLLGVSKETRMKLSLASRGKSPTEETRKKISKTLSGRKIEDHHMKNKDVSGERNAFHGKKHSESTRLKMRLAKKGKYGRACKIDGVSYASAAIASEELGISRNTIDYRLKSENFSNYVYED